MATKKQDDLDALIAKAVKEFGIDVPVMATRMVGTRLELHLYGGGVKVYQVEGDPDPEQSEQESREKPKRTTTSKRATRKRGN